MWNPSSQLPITALSTVPHSSRFLGAGHLPAGPRWGSCDAFPPVLSMSQLRLRVGNRLGQDHTAVVSDSHGASNPAGFRGPSWAGQGTSEVEGVASFLLEVRAQGLPAGPMRSWEWASGGSGRAPLWAAGPRPAPSGLTRQLAGTCMGLPVPAKSLVTGQGRDSSVCSSPGRRDREGTRPCGVLKLCPCPGQDAPLFPPFPGWRARLGVVGRAALSPPGSHSPAQKLTT